ncbi:MAG: sugar ABC transporter permease, partial [Clostridiales bacterium]|nr:sugar ABC transporter permease [Clostridiales bacterium]
MIKKRSVLRKYWPLYVMLVIPLVHFLLFKYGPMFGAILAFRRYRPGEPFGVEWRGLYYFETFFKDPQYWRAFRNTI